MTSGLGSCHHSALFIFVLFTRSLLRALLRAPVLCLPFLYFALALCFVGGCWLRAWLRARVMRFLGCLPAWMLIGRLPGCLVNDLLPACCDSGGRFAWRMPFAVRGAPCAPVSAALSLVLLAVARGRCERGDAWLVSNWSLTAIPRRMRRISSDLRS